MKNFWKIIVFTCLLTQFGYSYNTIKKTTSSFQKKNNTTKIDKGSLSSFQFVRPSIHRGAADLKNNNRIPIGLSYYFTELEYQSALRENCLKTTQKNQDINRCRSVSILLFPFHYFW